MRRIMADSLPAALCWWHLPTRARCRPCVPHAADCVPDMRRMKRIPNLTLFMSKMAIAAYDHVPTLTVSHGGGFRGRTHEQAPPIQAMNSTRVGSLPPPRPRRWPAESSHFARIHALYAIIYSAAQGKQESQKCDNARNQLKCPHKHKLFSLQPRHRGDNFLQCRIME